MKQINTIILITFILFSCSPNRSDIIIYQNELTFDIILHHQQRNDETQHVNSIYIESKSQEKRENLNQAVADCGHFENPYWQGDSVWLTSSTGDLLRVYELGNNKKSIFNDDDWVWEQDGGNFNCTITSTYIFSEEDLGN